MMVNGYSVVQDLHGWWTIFDGDVEVMDFASEAEAVNYIQGDSDVGVSERPD